MISFLQKKIYFKDILPDNFTDIHSHLLPGIDDGARSFEDTFFLINQINEIGISRVITTPHIIKNIWDNSKVSIELLEIETKNQLLKKDVHFPIKAAAEYMMDGEFVKLFQNEPLLTLKENYVLVEMSYINPPIQLYDIIFELQIAGYIPILAHPERYVFFHENFENYKKLMKFGCLFQLNLLSTVGYYGENVFKIAKKLLDLGMIEYVGTDIHHEKHINSFGNKILLKDISPLKIAMENNDFFSF